MNYNYKQILKILIIPIMCIFLQYDNICSNDFSIEYYTNIQEIQHNLNYRYSDNYLIDVGHSDFTEEYMICYSDNVNLSYYANNENNIFKTMDYLTLNYGHYKTISYKYIQKSILQKDNTAKINELVYEKDISVSNKIGIYTHRFNWLRFDLELYQIDYSDTTRKKYYLISFDYKPKILFKNSNSLHPWIHLSNDYYNIGFKYKRQISDNHSIDWLVNYDTKFGMKFNHLYPSFFVDYYVYSQYKVFYLQDIFSIKENQYPILFIVLAGIDIGNKYIGADTFIGITPGGIIYKGELNCKIHNCKISAFYESIPFNYYIYDFRHEYKDIYGKYSNMGVKLSILKFY